MGLGTFCMSSYVALSRSLLDDDLMHRKPNVDRGQPRVEPGEVESCLPGALPNCILVRGS